ncbi:MAG: hypothetical protein IJO29_01460 [Oscillospiraceae bacterium]|nr:hypothetical protein [Oscillospiraceae bacterium]
MEDKYRICPPKLNQPYILICFTVPELMVMAALFMLAVMAKSRPPLFVMAMVAVFQLRPSENIPCLSQYCRKLLNYCTSSQTLETLDNRKDESR